ncbi:MAG: Ezrin/radixin/moesin family protein [Bacteroidota bacterium]
MFAISNKKSLFLLLLMSCFMFGVQAQELSKEEIKKWKDLAKEYKKNPAGLKVLSERSEGLEAELDELNAEVGALQQENSSFQAQLNRKDSRIQSLEAQVNKLNMDLSQAQASIATMQEKGGGDNMGSGGDDMMVGVVFKVQIGAFNKAKKPMESNLAESDNLKVEETDEYQKVVVGQFRDYQSAKDLKDQLQKMGVKGAWIVSYKDGIRVSVKEALAG